jgi:hypothetical protein
MKIIFRSINKIAFFISICFISTSSFAQNKISLDEDWRFHFGNSADPSKDFNYGNVLLFHKSNVYDTTIVNPKFVDSAWTKINIPGITLSSHAQGITEIEKDTYILPVTVIYIDISNNYVPISGGKVTIRKANNKYITINYETINYPQSKLTAITSAANNAVTGMYISQSNEQYAMEAVNN